METDPGFHVSIRPPSLHILYVGLILYVRFQRRGSAAVGTKLFKAVHLIICFDTKL